MSKWYKVSFDSHFFYEITTNDSFKICVTIYDKLMKKLYNRSSIVPEGHFENLIELSEEETQEIYNNILSEL